MLVHELDLRYIYLTCLRFIGLFSLALSYYIDFNLVAVAAAAAAACCFFSLLFSCLCLFLFMFFILNFILFSLAEHTRNTTLQSVCYDKMCARVRRIISRALAEMRIIELADGVFVCCVYFVITSSHLHTPISCSQSHSHSTVSTAQMCVNLLLYFVAVCCLPMSSYLVCVFKSSVNFIDWIGVFFISLHWFQPFTFAERASEWVSSE